MNRPLSPIEHILWLIDQAVSQNFVMVANLSGPLKTSFFRQALDIVQQRHPPLRTKIKQGLVPEFVTGGVPQIPLRIINRENDEHWIKESEEEIHQPFSWTQGPFIRVVLLTSNNKCDLLVTCCHLVADATSGIKIIKNLLDYINKLSQGKTIVNAPSLSELPSSIDLLRKDLKYKSEFFDISSRIKRLFYKPVDLHGDVDASPINRTTRIIQLSLSRDETKKLTIRSKIEKTSVHGALCAALLQAVVEQMRKSQDVSKKYPLMIGCITPVNIRHLFCQPVEDDIGNFISDAFHYQLIDDRDLLWIAARKIKKSLQKELRFGRDIKALRELARSTPAATTKASPKEVAIEANKTFPPVAVTNMGQLDIPDKFGALTLENLHFTLSINPAAKGGFVLSVTNLGGRTTMNFLYAEPFISKERATVMAESTLKRLKEAIS